MSTESNSWLPTPASAVEPDAAVKPETAEPAPPVKTEPSAEAADTPTPYLSSLIPATFFRSLVSLSSPISLQSLPPGTVLVPIRAVPGTSSMQCGAPRIVPLPSMLERLSSSSVMHTHIDGDSDSDMLTLSHVSVPACSSASASGSDDDSDAMTLAQPKLKRSYSKKSKRKRCLSASVVETDSDCHSTISDDSHDSHHSHGSHSSDRNSVSSDESGASTKSHTATSSAADNRKRRCVNSGLKFDSTSKSLDMRLEFIDYQQHPIRIIIVNQNDRNLVYCHGADVGGVIERKSNISRMYGQFLSPTEKLLMNVTGHHNHTVGQESNVLTVDGIRRLMTLKKCLMNKQYCQWLEHELIPRIRALQEAPVSDADECSVSPIRRAASASLPFSTAGTDTDSSISSEDSQPSSPLHLFASICV